MMIAFKVYTKLPFVYTRIVCKTFLNVQCKMLNLQTCRQFVVFKSPIYYTQKLWPSYFLTYRYMAGHSKWQNVKHVKAEKDKLKSTLCNKYVRLVTAAVREKGPDPKNNIKLANILEDARKNNVPFGTLESALKKANNKKLQYGTIEMLGPGGCLIILEYETENIGEMRHYLKVLCRKHSIGIFPGTSERWRAAYNQKGIIKVSSELNGEALENEKMLEAAIEAGAEDVQKIEDDSVVYEFLCAPDDLNIVKKELEKKFRIEEAFVGYLPMSTVVLTDADKNVAMSFLNELDDLPDVYRLYENIE